MINNWREKLPLLSSNACSGCDICDGHGCQGQIPGMGGLGSGSTFMNNFNSWQQIQLSSSELNNALLPKIGVAPMTGVYENMGNPATEPEFHKMIVAGAKKAGILSTIGDGTPDFKLQSGAQALRDNHVKGAVFFKPYPNNLLFERYEWVADVADICGLDIDSYKIVTMAGKALLEKKTAQALLELKSHIRQPFVVKGVSSEEDVILMEEVRPDIVVVSNHGGRVSDGQEGIAFSLQRYADRLRKCCGEIWVDGGIRSYQHLQKAGFLGASRVLIGRPFIQGTIVFKEEGIGEVIAECFSKSPQLVK